MIHIRPIFAYTQTMFDPDASLPRPDKPLLYVGSSLIAGLRLARATQGNVPVVPANTAIAESVELASEIFNRIFRKRPVSVDKHNQVNRD